MPLHPTLLQAVHLHRAGRVAEAAALYHEVLQADPRNPDATHLLGMATLRLGQPVEALSLLRKAYELNASLPGLADNMAGAVRETLEAAEGLARAGEPIEAAKLYKAALVAQPDGEEGRSGLAAALAAAMDSLPGLVGQGRLIDAAERCREVLRLRPDYPDAAARLAAALHLILAEGLQHRNEGRNDAAAHCFRGVLKCDPLNVDALYFLGLLERDAGAAGVAAALWCHALSLSPEHEGVAGALSRLGAGFYVDRDMDAALGVLTRVAQITKGARETALAAAVVALETGQGPLALDLIIQGLGNPPTSAADRDAKLRSAYFLIERTVFDDRLLARAWPLAVAALRDDPANPMAAKIIAFRLYLARRWNALGRLWRRYFATMSLARVMAVGQGLPLWYGCRFDPEFFEGLDPLDDYLEKMPPMTVVAAARGGDGPVLFFSCDDRYWTLFGRRAVAAVRRLSGEPNLHVHVVDASPATVDELRRLAEETPFLGASVEDTAALAGRLTFQDFRRAYYASIRLVRLYQALHIYRRPVCQFDVDCLLHGDVLEELARHADDDVTVVFGARNGPYNEYQAGVVLVKDTETGRAYIDIVARYICEHILRIAPLWTLDQAAMFCAKVQSDRLNLGVRLGFFGKALYDYCTFPHGEMEGKLDAFERWPADNTS